MKDNRLEVIRQNITKDKKVHPLKWLWIDLITFVYIRINSIKIRYINRKIDKYEKAIYKISEQKEKL